MKNPAPTRDQGKFVVRMPPGMRDKVAQAAAAAGRSMNAEIVYRLESSFDQAEREELQGKMLAVQGIAVEKTTDMVELLAQRLIKAMTILAANEDGTTATLGETIERAKKASEKLGDV